MNKLLMAFALLALPVLATAQDMPLHEIIKAGETWKSAGKEPEGPKALYEAMPTEKAVKGPTDPAKGESRIIQIPLAKPSCTTVWHNGASLLVGDAGGKHVWTFRIDKEGTLSGGEKYCPLRLRPGETESEVSALCVDGSNRVYAAYKAGIMVFDPTGRPCGLITSPGSGQVTKLIFAGNKLYAMIGEEQYVRTMLARE
ncbi:SMP-30/gluconolactonase/LRE family protein [Zavarzinella formosa]|uniref:SMP-30/gluconolactonase/LRE family protein n=1 Tax=Zavarzinella formosa TaxID=360055 RepID=UPI0002D79A85|nr:SMP-30/gluconolactonase/LRE family protein [Zavarzinella formosa]